MPVLTMILINGGKIMACSDQVSPQDLEDAKKYVQDMYTFEYSNELSFVDFDGVTRTTAKGLESKYIMTAINGGIWAAGQEFTAYNQYMNYNGVPYKPKRSVVLPYTVGVIPDANNVEPFEAGLSDKDIINDLSQSYVFSTVAEYKAFVTEFPIGKTIKLLDRLAEFAVISGAGAANDLDVIASDQVSQSINLKAGGVYIASQLGAKHDSTDSSAVLNYIMTKSNYVIDGAYSVGSSLIVQNATKGEMRGATLTALSNTFDLLTGVGKSKFSMTGDLEIVGIDKTTSIHKGINFFDCFDYDMSCNPDVSEFETGIFCDGTTIAASLLDGHRGRQGRWTNPTSHNNQIGIQTLRRAEYTLWSSPQVTQNTAVGWINSAGNTNVGGAGNIQDNQNGVLLQEDGTTNANHGMFTGINMNHNIGYNLRCEDVSFGHSFSGCHIYGDSDSAGVIELIRSSGINITDGIIDAKIIVDGDVTPSPSVAGWNRISGNQIDGTFTSFESTNNGREKTIVTDNFSRGGDAWGFNDRSFTNVRADTVGGSQSISDSVLTTVIFNKELSDNRKQYNSTSGVFTASQAQDVTVSFQLQLSISGGSFTDGFAQVTIGTELFFFPLIATSVAGTFVVSCGSVSNAIVSSTDVDVRVFCNVTSGSISVVAGSGTALQITSSN